MSRSLIKINGIRLNSDLIQATQDIARDCVSIVPFYQELAQGRMNISCLGLWNTSFGTSLFCCHDRQSSGHAGHRVMDGTSSVSVVSVYPHHYSLNFLGVLIGLLGKHGICFKHMVSSHAMISFVVDRSNQERLLELLEREFDLPCTHTPFLQEFNDQTTAFVKKRYPETRAFYVEEKIKTYGIQMDAGLEMFEIPCNPLQPDQLEICGKGLQDLATAAKKFYFTCCTHDNDASRLFCLTDPVASDPVASDSMSSRERQAFFPESKAKGADGSLSVMVDLIGFHGPHFGDRFGIFNTAMACLTAESIPVLVAGCTGASIFIVLPAMLGKKAVAALAQGFEIP